jgi:hypothetical protein
MKKRRRESERAGIAITIAQSRKTVPTVQKDVS